MSLGKWHTHNGSIELVFADVNKYKIATIRNEKGKNKIKFVKWDGFKAYIIHKSERYYLKDIEFVTSTKGDLI